jgi:hypothetical protein
MIMVVFIAVTIHIRVKWLGIELWSLSIDHQ